MGSRFAPLAALLFVGCTSGEPITEGITTTFGPGFSTGSETDGSDSDTESSAGTGGSGPSSDTASGTASASGTATDSGSETDSGDTCIPEAEVCDNLDNDCDGVVDNGNPGGGEDCDTGMAGACAAGETVCDAGAVQCLPLARSQPETCDNIDNDCDGAVDNGDPGGGEDCDTGMLGACAAGTTACQNGAVSCVQLQQPEAESCDGVDNDCNGQTDEGNPEGGGSCNTGMFGVCSAGTEACVGGDIICEQNVAAAPDETCGNGLDDDCNGAADDGCGCPFGLCETPGQPMLDGCNPCVSQICDVDPYCCTNQWDSLCVGRVASVCGQADCVAPTCAHLVCISGGALDSNCHTCVNQICAVDPYCCSTSWDGLCVTQVGTVCGLACP